MAMLQMQRISICALKKNRKQILEILQRRGMIEINDLIPEDSVFQRTDLSSSQAVFEKNAAEAVQALEILEKYVPEKKPMFAMLNGRKEICVDNYYTFSKERDELIRLSRQINTLAKEVAEHKADILKYTAQGEALTPWLSLDIPMSFKGTKSTTAFIGTLPGGLNLEGIYEQLAQQAPSTGAIHLDIISTSQEQTCVLLLCHKRDSAAVEEALRTMGFARPSSLSQFAPTQLKAELEQNARDAQLAIDAAEKEIKSYVGERNGFRFIADYYHTRSEKYEVIGHLVQSNRTFILSGYIAERDAQALENELNNQFAIAIERQDPSPDEDVPVLLQNNGFASPVEGVLESFSLPGKGEVDPSNVMAAFYYFLFGLMLSDAAYGIIMATVCGVILIKHKNIENGLKQALKMFFFCGISTTFWGVMFGSYFGDVVDVVSTTFFGMHLTIPAVWFVPINEPMRMLVFSLAIGVVHLFAGLGMQFYQLCKAKKYKDVLYDVIFWYALLTSLILMLLSMQMFVNIVGLKFILSAKVGSIASIVAVVAATGITLTSGRESRNPFKRFLKGLYGLYGVTGYLSDVLSYSRLLALGLATSVIATVINKMGSMVGGGVMGAVVFILVFILGHTVNMGINALGAYVHTNRLQFVEFFGKFYQGGGRKFTPFAINTKYFKIKEETNHG